MKAALQRDVPTMDLSFMVKGEAAATTSGTTGSPSVASARSLTSIGATGAQGTLAAGSQRDTAPTVATAPTVPKQPAGLRALRRMNADGVITALQPAFQACYVREDSHSSGTIVVRANTTATGEVESVEIASTSGLPLGVVTCVADRVHEAHFGAPGGSGVSVAVPVRLGR